MTVLSAIMQLATIPVVGVIGLVIVAVIVAALKVWFATKKNRRP
jgi:hypothetical protein